ncbi:TetR/AcrR family transcriptional regulator [Fodinicola acaciae]|uniref:TetR/AcrR family transcriptional regulator n=1 Tax=Fodinicola acaciae TaxID=2681555 RepID=UPI0013D07174|nr:TetR/AcrR family transcriptional regulator [Fodinicola acaciae]
MVTATPEDGSGLQMQLSGREAALVGSAYRVISRQGVHRTSLQNIADDAAVSKGLLLYHFKSKDQLLLTTMRWALLRTADRIRENIASVEDDPRRAAEAIIDAVFIGAQQNRDFYLLYLDLVEHAARAPGFSNLSVLTSTIINGLYGEILRDGQKRGIFPIANVEEAAATMRAYIDGCFVSWLQQHDWRAAYPRYREMALNGLLSLLGVHKGQ